MTKNYFFKNYLTIYFILTILKFVSGVLLFLFAAQDFKNFQQCVLYIKHEDYNQSVFENSSWTLTFFYFYLCVMIFEFIISIVVIINANHLIRNPAFQVAKQALKAGAGALGGSYAIV